MSEVDDGCCRAMFNHSTNRCTSSSDWSPFDLSIASPPMLLRATQRFGWVNESPGSMLTPAKFWMFGTANLWSQSFPRSMCIMGHRSQAIISTHAAFVFMLHVFDEKLCSKLNRCTNWHQPSKHWSYQRSSPPRSLRR